jgi:NAD(P)-dependent dehydrogenase (short-subunit alcohol dehydrogenase family)
VTGGGTGIGAAAARMLARHGVAVALVGRRSGPLEEVRASIETEGGEAIALAFDMGNPETPSLIVEATEGAFGQLDIVVNNAAVIRNGPFESFDRSLFDQHYAVNVAGPFFLVQAALPALRRSDDAAVVNVSSSVGSIVKAGTMLYASTKAALEYLTRSWAYELAVDRIRVNAIAPGPVATAIHATYSDDLEATYAELEACIPIGRLGTVEDVAAWVWMLVDPASAWTTGNVVHVDGGQVLGFPP